MPVVVGDSIPTFTEGVQQSLMPWGPLGSDWQNLNAAYGAMFEPVFRIVQDIGSPDEPASFSAGWSRLLDPDVCPVAFLPYLAQFNGTLVPQNTSEGAARAAIKAEAGFIRGTLPSIASAVERAQAAPDPSRFAIQERTAPGGPDPYHFLISIDLSSLVTQGDPTQLIANVNQVKPAGLLFTVVPFTAPLLSQYARLMSAVVVDLNAAQLSDVS